MSPTFKSGAFIQQCFAVHPLCLSLKKLELPERIVLSCSSCNLLHRLTVRAMTTGAAALLQSAGEVRVTKGERTAVDHLAECAATHQSALGVRAMDVARDSVGLRCAECRRMYDLDVSAFETHQR
ncbi:MAG: hypothetical protein HY581_00800 [Nitrospirae bacterium]|nr:hypothetical protein [Nitrospirota bacterium]